VWPPQWHPRGVSFYFKTGPLSLKNGGELIFLATFSVPAEVAPCDATLNGPTCDQLVVILVSIKKKL
jgi:hypothetical protein